MTESVFSKVYSYREREGNNSKENFLIEIFAHCLQTDDKLLDDFFNEIDLVADNETSIKTQAIYEYGRPDIEINIPSSKTCILIECKIEHFERENQLDDYKNILKEKKVSKRHLVYLTKYYDLRENDNKLINLHLLKWADIYNIIDENNTELTKELKSFIKDENMEESKNFNYADLSSLKNITGTIRKMDEVLDSVKDYFEKKIGSLSKGSARSTRLKDESYSNYHMVGGTNHKFNISIGFNWEEGDIYITVNIWLPTAEKYKNSLTYLKLFKKCLKGWEVEEYDNCYTISDYRPIAQFIIEEEEQIPAMVEYLKLCIDDLESLKKVDPKIFK